MNFTSKKWIGFISACVLVSLSGQTHANPTGAQTVNGSVQINAIANQLNIHNSNGAIINWQNFSIGQQEITRFIQQNSTSAVLNRVVGQNPSAIMGQLLSNGHVFLLNPNGVVFGANAVVDTAGLVASSLNMSDESFLSGQYKFSGDASNGAVINRGLITAGKGGEIVLIAPTVENHGVISVEGGRILLAAGEKMTLSSLDLEGIEFEVQAPTNTAMNLGKLLASGGSVGVFAGSLTNTGFISANSVTQGKDGKLWLEASGEATVGGKLSAPDITIAGSDIALEGADINASSDNGGGQIRIGGDYQGAALGPYVSNAKRLTIDAATTISANAQTHGDGGRVIVWSDENTVVNGHISATGGSQSGNGGFVETSGKKALDFTTPVDVSATSGKAGTWLIDPEDITIDESKASSIETALNAGSNVEVKTSDTGEGEGNITVAAAITKSEGDDATLLLDAHNKIDVNAPITSTSNKLDVKLTAGKQVNVNSNITTNGGSVATLITGTTTAAETPADPIADSVIDTNEAVTDPATETTSEPAPEPVADPVPAEIVTPEETTVATTDTSPAEASVTVEETVVASALVDTLTDVTTHVTGYIETSGGDITIDGGDTGMVAIEGTLDSSNLKEGEVGGTIQILGDKVGLFGEAKVDASGDAGGGTILIGGDKQGENPDVQNATSTYIGEDTSVSADAMGNGDGGKVIVFAEDSARIYGSLSAQGGAEGGDGGFVETSGKKYLSITTTPDISAANGSAGSWLIDPEDDVHIVAAPTIINNTGTNPFTTDGNGQSDIGVGLLVAALTGGATVEVISNAGSSGQGDIYLDSGVTLDYSGTGVNTLRFTPAAGSDVYILGNITTSGGATNLNIDFNTSGGGNVDVTGRIVTGGIVGGGSLTMSDAAGTISFIDTGRGSILGAYNVAGTTKLIDGAGGARLALLGDSTHGIFEIDALSSLSINFGTHNFNAGSSITGAGSVDFLSGTTNFNSGSSYSITGLTNVQSGTVNFNTGNKVILNALTLNNTNSSPYFGVWGNDDLDINGAFNWSAGTLRGSNTRNRVVTANAGINITGNGIKYLGLFDDEALTLVNPIGQTLSWSGDGNLVMRATTSLVNKGDFNVSGNSKALSMDSGVTGTFENQGTTDIALNTGEKLIIDTIVKNSAAINLSLGELEFRGDGGLLTSGGTHTATSSLTAAGGTILRFTRSNHTFENGATVSFPGDVNISRGTIEFNTGATVAFAGLTQSGGTLQGSDDMTIAGLYDWSGGMMGGSGTTTANGGINITGQWTQAYLRDTRTLINPVTQTFSMSDGWFYTLGSSSFINQGNFNITADNRFFGGVTGVFENQGTTTVTLNSAADVFGFDTIVKNTGLINLVQGELEFSSGSTHSATSTLTAAASSTLSFSGNGKLHDFSAGATVNLGSADVVVGQTSVIFDTGGPVNFGTLTLENSGFLYGNDNRNISGMFTWDSGILGGNGITTASGGILMSSTTGRTLGRSAADTTRLINSGTANWTGGDFNLLGTNTRFVNDSIFNMSGGGKTMTGAGRFDNNGTTNINLGSNFSSQNFHVDVVNTGSINVNTGHAQFRGNTTHTGTASLTGTGGASISLSKNLTDTVHDFAAGTTLSASNLIVRGDNSIINLNTGSTVTVGTLELRDTATLGGDDDMTIAGLFTWREGTLGGDGTTTANAGMSLTTITKNIGSSTADSRTLINALGQTANWTSGTINIVGNTASFVNEGTLSISGGSKLLSDTGGGLFDNRGLTTVNLTNSTDFFIIRSELANIGDINVQNGILWFQEDGSHTGTATVSGDAGTTIRFSSGLFTQSFGAGTTLSADILDLGLSGTIDLNTGNTVNIANFILKGGTLKGSDDVNISGLFDWSLGRLGGTGTTTANGGILFSGTNEKSLGAVASDTITLINASGQTANWDDGDIRLNGSSTRFINDGTFNITGSSREMFWFGRFTNNGDTNITMDTDADVIEFAASTSNNGSINLLKGGMNVSRTLTNIGAGVINANAGTVLEFSGGVTRISDATSVNAETLLLSGSSLYIDDNLVVNNFIHTGGVLRGSNSLTINNGWTPTSGVSFTNEIILGAGINESLASITLNGTGLLTNLGTLTLDNSIVNTSFDNRGTLNASNTTFSGVNTTLTSGTFNVSSGTVNVSSGVFDWKGGSIAGTGTLDLTSASSADLTGNNARVLDGTTLIYDDFLLAGGSLELRSGTLNDVALSTIASGATLLLSGGLFDSAGGMDVNGTLTMAGGDLNVNTSPLNINVGGLLNGDAGGGTITGDVFNFGTIAPGNSPGTINIAGNLTLDANSLLDFEVGPDSSTYDILNVSGQVDFGGASLAINWFGGYVPAAGDSYQMINYGGFTGSLGSVTAPIGVSSDYLQNNLLISALIALAPVIPGTVTALPIIPVDPVLPVYPVTGNVIQLVVAMWEDAVSQWVHDPSDLSSAYILTGAINGDNGDRESGGKGQKVYLAEWSPEAGDEYRAPLMCN